MVLVERMRLLLYMPAEAQKLALFKLQCCMPLGITLSLYLKLCFYKILTHIMASGSIQLVVCDEYYIPGI